MILTKYCIIYHLTRDLNKCWLDYNGLTQEEIDEKLSEITLSEITLIKFYFSKIKNCPFFTRPNMTELVAIMLLKRSGGWWVVQLPGLAWGPTSQ